jgi:hypothetical protein
VALGWQVLNVLNVWNQPEVQKNTLKLRSERIRVFQKKVVQTEFKMATKEVDRYNFNSI